MLSETVFDYAFKSDWDNVKNFDKETLLIKGKDNGPGRGKFVIDYLVRDIVNHQELWNKFYLSLIAMPKEDIEEIFTRSSAILKLAQNCDYRLIEFIVIRKNVTANKVYEKQDDYKQNTVFFLCDYSYSSPATLINILGAINGVESLLAQKNTENVNSVWKLSERKCFGVIKYLLDNEKINLEDFLCLPNDDYARSVSAFWLICENLYTKIAYAIVKKIITLKFDKFYDLMCSTIGSMSPLNWLIYHQKIDLLEMSLNKLGDLKDRCLGVTEDTKKIMRDYLKDSEISVVGIKSWLGYFVPNNMNLCDRFGCMIGTYNDAPSLFNSERYSFDEVVKLDLPKDVKYKIIAFLGCDDSCISKIESTGIMDDCYSRPNKRAKCTN